MAFLAALLKEFMPYIIAAGGGIIAVAGIYFKGKSAGKKKMLDQQRKADIKAHTDREEIENEVDAAPIDAVRERLRNDARK